MKYKDFYKELLLERVDTLQSVPEDQKYNFEIGDRVNVKNNRGNGNWKISKIDGDDIYLMYGRPEKPTKFHRSQLYVTEKNKKDVLSEGKNVPIIIIDVQPEYDKWCRNVSTNLMDFLNKGSGKVIAFYNGPDLGMSDELEVKDYFLSNGLEEEKLDDIEFRAKTYAFFRPWMDSGMDRKNLIKAIRYLVINRKNDSRDVDVNEWPSIFGDEWPDVEHIVEVDSINIPDISLSELKTYNGCYLCGGGEEECLAEFRLLMDSFNLKYKLVRNFIY